MDVIKNENGSEIVQCEVTVLTFIARGLLGPRSVPPSRDSTCVPWCGPVCVCVCVYVSVHMLLCVCVCVCVYYCVCMCLCICDRVCMFLWASLVAQLVKNPPTTQETPV